MGEQQSGVGCGRSIPEGNMHWTCGQRDPFNPGDSILCDACRTKKPLDARIAQLRSQLATLTAEVEAAKTETERLQRCVDAFGGKHVELSDAAICEIRKLTNAAGHEGVAFIDDAVAAIIAELETANRWIALARKLDALPPPASNIHYEESIRRNQAIDDCKEEMRVIDEARAATKEDGGDG